MKYIKNFKIFESNYSLEEFIDVIYSELSKFNISPVEMNRIINNQIEEIKYCLDAGISPKIWVDELISDMELGKKDYLGMLSTKPKQFLNKYL
jgi:hypothetical protein